MSKAKTLIGTELDSVIRTIEKGQIINLAKATNFDFGLLESLTTLPGFLYGALINLEALYQTLGLNSKHVLLSRESVTHHRLVEVGETIKIRTFLKDAYEQQATANPIGFLVLESVGQIDKEFAFYAERVIAVRGGFSRGKK